MGCKQFAYKNAYYSLPYSGCTQTGTLQSRRITCTTSSTPPLPSNFNVLVLYDDAECNSPREFTALPDEMCREGLLFDYPHVSTYVYSNSCPAAALQDYRDYTTCTETYYTYNWGRTQKLFGRMVHAGTAIIPGSSLPSQTPTYAPTGGQLYTVEGDIMLSNLDYASFSASDKSTYVSSVLTSLQSILIGFTSFATTYPIAVTVTPVTTSRRHLLSSSSSLRTERVHPETTTAAGVNIHFSILATDLLLTGSSAANAAALAETVKNKFVYFHIPYNFPPNHPAYSAQYQSAAVSAVMYISPSYAPTIAPPILSPTLSPTQAPSLPTVSSTSSSSNDKKSSSNMIVIVVPVVVGSVFLIALIFGAIYFSSYVAPGGTSPAENKTAAKQEPVVGDYALVAAADSTTVVATTVNVETI
jgi:hypothetical protein